MSVTLRLADQLDVGRGDMLVSPADQPPAARELDCTVCWMSEDALHVGRRYALKHTSRTVRATVQVISERTDPETLERMVEAGLDVARLNFSHGDRDIHAENASRVRAAAALRSRPSSSVSPSARACSASARRP